MFHNKKLFAFMLTSLAMLAFAGNSIICRMALVENAIDAASFSSLRLLAGAITLLGIVIFRPGPKKLLRSGSWISASMLFVYVVGFSYAYIDLGAGTGALILFGLVQATMIAAALLAGDRPSAIEMLGWLSATAGLVVLVFPGIEAPSVPGTILMSIAGIAWGVYSIRGKREADPLLSTASNFLRSVAFVPLVLVFALQTADLSNRGVLLAILSGAITSGVGYVIWYAALKYMKTIQAALVQLSVPAIAALGGVLLLDESLNRRLIISAAMILGGISLALLRRSGRRDSA